MAEKKLTKKINWQKKRSRVKNSLGVRGTYPRLVVYRSNVHIYAQLVDDNGKLVDDLVVKEHENSIHILNAVSPGMTCSMPFADHIIENYVNKLNFKEK